jgi:3-hydroxy-3-methylglutaryl CoA synthase
MLVIPPPYADNTLRVCGHVLNVPAETLNVHLQYQGEEIFYVKFGDGTARDAYDTHNPCFESVLFLN